MKFITEPCRFDRGIIDQLLPLQVEPIMNSTLKPGESLQRLVRALEQATNDATNVKVESPKANTGQRY
jgi:hypothetical protein